MSSQISIPPVDPPPASSASESSRSDSAHERNRSIKLAVATSILSKGGTAFLTLVAIPFTTGVIGRDLFGLYGSVYFTITSAQLLSAGLGPALVHGLSTAKATGDRDSERALYATSFWLLVCLLALGAIIGTICLSTISIERILGPDFVKFEVQAQQALWIGMVLLLGTLLFSHTERVREGILQAQVNNSWGALGNVLTALVMLAGIRFFPTVTFLLVATFGLQLLVRLGNTVQLMRANPWLRPLPSLVRPRLAGQLFVDGMASTCYAMMVNFVELNLASNLLGRIHGTHTNAMFMAFSAWMTAGLGVVLMFTTSSLPAIVDAKVRGDWAWIKKSVIRLYGIALVVGLGAIGCLAVAGQYVMVLQYGHSFADATPIICICFGVYFFLHVWRHVGHILHLSLGRVKWLAGVQLVESAIMVCGVYWAVNQHAVETIYLMMALIIAVGLGWILPWTAWSEIRRGERAAQDTATPAKVEGPEYKA